MKIKTVGISSLIVLLVAGVQLNAWADAASDAAAKQAQVDFYRGSLGHTGVAAESLTAPVSLLWRHTTSFAQNNPASAVYADATAYFVSGGSVFAINAADGTKKWQYPANGKAPTFFAATPALAGGSLYVTDDNGQAYKLEAATGHEIWTSKVEGALRSAPVVSGGIIYFGSNSDHCYALSTETGRVLWDTPTTGAITTSPIITGNVVTFASSDNSVYGLNAHTGRQSWSTPFDADPSSVPIVYDGSQIYVTAGDTLYRVNPSTGTKRAFKPLPANILVAPTVSSDTVYAITQQFILYALSSSGQERWRVTLDSAATAPPLLAGSLLLVPTQNGVLSGYDSGNGKLVWRYVVQASATDSQPKAPSTEVHAAPILAGGTLYVVSDDGTLSAFRTDAVDLIGPQLTQRVPEEGATVRSRGLVYGTFLVDDGSGINPDTVSLQIDGQADGKAHYSARQNAIYSMPDTPLAEGSHTLTVKATDWRGNNTTESWIFTVQNRRFQTPQDGNPGGPFDPNAPVDPNSPNYPGAGGGDPNAPPPPPPIAPF